MRRRHLTLLAPVILIAVAGCSSEDTRTRDTTARDGTAEGSASGDTDPSATPGPAVSWPAFEPTDYTYRLRVLCYCPQSGPIDVTVSDAVVTSAVIAGGPARGSDAPEFARLTIDEILDAATSADAGEGSAEVVWPDGSDHPTSVQIDRIAGAVDDEVTYTIRNVVVSP